MFTIQQDGWRCLREQSVKIYSADNRKSFFNVNEGGVCSYRRALYDHEPTSGF